MPNATMRLEDLLAPVSCETFFRECWERQPLLVPRESPGAYAGLFSLADIDAVVAYSRPRFSDPSAFATRPTSPPTYVRGVLADQPPLSPLKAPGIAELRQAFDQGKSVVIMSMQHRWGPIAQLCRNLEGVFHCPIHANLYLTPPGAQGFAAHYDPHEVFALQLEGTKHWRLYERTERLPLADSVGTPTPPLGAARDIRLAPGDLLYIPRGHVHDAYTDDSHSLHLTIGINVYRWAELLHHALAIVSRRDARLRESIPGGALARPNGELRQRFVELLTALAETDSTDVLFDEALCSLGDQFFGELGALPGGRFADRPDLDRIGLETILERPARAFCRVVENESAVAIEFPGNRVAGPRRIAAALRFVAGATRFAVRELPDELNAEGKVVLARRLVREGLLEVQALNGPESARCATTEDGAANEAAPPGNGKISAPARKLQTEGAAAE